MSKLSALVALLSVSISLVSGVPMTRRLFELADGEFCGADVDCQSNNCQLVNSLFTCVPPGSLGDGSTLRREVVSRLNELADGEFCGADVDCQSNNCQLVNSLFTCVPPGSLGDGSQIQNTAAPSAPQLNSLPDGQFCGADVDCQSNNCQLVNSLFTCVPPGSTGDGSQIQPPTAPATSPAPSGPQLNSLPDGQFCGADVDCQSNNCQLVNSLFTCVPPGSLGDGSQIDNTVVPTNVQLNTLPDGEFCGADVDCQSNNCQLVKSLFTCVPPGSTGDGSTLRLRRKVVIPRLFELADGEFCGADVDCQSNNCQLVNSLFTCVPPGSLGDGSQIQNTAAPSAPQLNSLPDGQFCGADVDCQSNNCQLVNSLFTCVPPGSLGDGSTLRL